MDPIQSVADLTDQLADLLEIEAIKQLKARYFRLMDTKQWDAWGEVFSPEARLQWGESEEDAAAGRANIVAAVRGAIQQAVTCHHGHTPEISIVDSEHATGIWSMFDRVDHPSYLLEGYGHYTEEYVKIEGEWKIDRTRLTRLHRDFTLKPEAPR
jgi:hypothetical protein